MVGQSSQSQSHNTTTSGRRVAFADEVVTGNLSPAQVRQSQASRALADIEASIDRFEARASRVHVASADLQKRAATIARARHVQSPSSDSVAAMARAPVFAPSFAAAAPTPAFTTTNATWVTSPTPQPPPQPPTTTLVPHDAFSRAAEDLLRPVEQSRLEVLTQIDALKAEVEQWQHRVESARKAAAESAEECDHAKKTAANARTEASAATREKEDSERKREDADAAAARALARVKDAEARLSDVFARGKEAQDLQIEADAKMAAAKRHEMALDEREKAIEQRSQAAAEAERRAAAATAACVVAAAPAATSPAATSKNLKASGRKPRLSCAQSKVTAPEAISK